MPDKFSVVIVCKNEADVISKVLESVRHLTDDVVVYDSGSTDGTLSILEQYRVQVHIGEWMGYGKTKQQAVGLAKYDWVLSIDADEAPDRELQDHLQNISFAENAVYSIKFKNFLGDKYLRWGEWGGDKHVRLFNRRYVNWNDAEIHEKLDLPSTMRVVQLKGYILHYTMKDMAEYSSKVVKYAMLNAEKYFRQGRKATFIKRFIGPSFSFAKHYIFQLGFLDGWAGLVSAYMTYFYVFLKYARLHELWKMKKG